VDEPGEMELDMIVHGEADVALSQGGADGLEGQGGVWGLET